MVAKSIYNGRYGNDGRRHHYLKCDSSSFTALRKVVIDEMEKPVNSITCYKHFELRVIF